jgi:carboxyl-terminal processing protease
VLVDGGTAGSSEVLAAALRDDLGARVVGSTTFGDGTEQHVVPMPNGAAVSITHAHMLSPKGTVIEGKGLKPDYPGGAGEAGIDAAVKALAAPGKPAAAATPTGRR